MNNVKPITKPFGVDSLWPKQPYHRVCYALLLNTPAARGKQTYSFCVKTALGSREHKDAVIMCLDLQSTGHVGFQALQLVKADERIADYCAKNRGWLRDVANAMPQNTVYYVVGKLTKHEGRETFIVYYIIENGVKVLLDAPTLKARLSKADKDFLLVLEPYTIVDVEIDGAASTTSCPEFDSGNVRDDYVAFPIQQLDPRGPNDTPIMTTTPMHMRFMAFHYNGVQS